MSDGARHDRELAYYRREITDMGVRLLRTQDDLSKALRDSTRSRMVIRLLRDLSRLSDQGNVAVITSTSLEVIAEYQLCDRGAFLREIPERPGFFQYLQTIGFSSPPPTAVSIASPPRFAFATGLTGRDVITDRICDAIGMPFVAWCYDPQSGFALLLANAREDTPIGPFSAADQDIIEAVMSVYLDAIEGLQPTVPMLEPEAVPDVFPLQPYSTGVEAPIFEAEIKRSLAGGGSVTAVLAVERSVAEGGEYAIYLRTSWDRDYRILIATKTQKDRTYRELSRLVAFARSVCAFYGDVSVRLQGDPFLHRLPGILSSDKARSEETSFSSFAKTEST